MNGDRATGLGQRSQPAIGTTLTNFWSIPLPIGDYRINGIVHVIHVGPPTGFTCTPNFVTGAVGFMGLTFMRYISGTAPQIDFRSSFSATGSSLFTYMTITGGFQVQVEGTLTIGFTRTGGTSSTIQRGSWIEVLEQM